ncbi:MAG: sporulation integral membrane protein YtvI [Halothermotrichaceae bacterium]
MEYIIKKIIMFFMLVIITVIFIIVIKYIFIWFCPFIIAVVFASMINPIVNIIEKNTFFRRGLAVFIVLLLFISIIITFIIFGISHIYLELNSLVENIPDYRTLGNKIQWFINQNNKLEKFVNNLEISAAVKNTINENLQLLYNTVKDGVIILTNSLFNMISKLPMFISILFISFIATFFMSRDIDIINDFVIGLFPDKLKGTVFKVEKELISSAVGYIRAELILISITGLITVVGLVIMRIPYAVTVAITAAILDLIPIIGPALIFVPWIIYSIIGGQLSFALRLLILYTIMAAVRQGAEGNVMGSSLGFHPLTVMSALYVGYRVFGTTGFIIGPAVLVIGKVLFNINIIKIKG